MDDAPSSTSKSPTPIQENENVDEELAQDQNEEENKTEQQDYRQIAAAHIDTLSEVNRQVPKMLTYFATALSQLTNNPIQEPRREGEPSREGEKETLADRQAACRKYCLFVAYGVAEIRDELLKQINDLAAHKVIPKRNWEGLKEAQKNADKDAVDTEKEVRNAGYGEFDVGVLNARVASGQGSEEHVLDRVKGILEELKKHGIEEKNGDEMVVDG